MGTVIGFLVVGLLVALGGAVIIYIVGKLRLGLEVDNFGSAFVAAIVIAFVSVLVHLVTDWLGLTGTGTWLAVIANVIVAAIILMISDRFVKGMRVDGFWGALAGAISIGVLTGLARWLASLL